jgi:hypothetical protein
MMQWWHARQERMMQWWHARQERMMQWWHALHERRRQWRQWRDEHKGVSNPQFRKMVEAGSTWYQTPGKQRWAEWELFRRERLTARILTIAGLILTFIFGLLALWK